MALNIATPLEKRGGSLGLSQQFRNKYNITVNQVQQSHYSVEGVQTYTLAEIKAMVSKAQRSNQNKKEGSFVPLKAYKIDNQIQFLENAPSNKEKIQALRSKSKVKLESVKKSEIKQQVKPKKPSNKQELKQANQKKVRLTKEEEKMKKMQDKLDSLTKQYKEHFGDTIKLLKTDKKNNRKQQQQQQQDQNLNQNQNQAFTFEQNQGDQCLAPKKDTSTKKNVPSLTKDQDEEDNDVSFEQVPWEPKNRSSIDSRVKKNQIDNSYSYSERLGNAVHFLFD